MRQIHLRRKPRHRQQKKSVNPAERLKKIARTQRLEAQRQEAEFRSKYHAQRIEEFHDTI